MECLPWKPSQNPLPHMDSSAEQSRQQVNSWKPQNMKTAQHHIFGQHPRPLSAPVILTHLSGCPVIHCVWKSATKISLASFLRTARSTHSPLLPPPPKPWARLVLNLEKELRLCPVNAAAACYMETDPGVDVFAHWTPWQQGKASVGMCSWSKFPLSFGGGCW